MTGNLQAIGFLFTWVLGWGIGGSLIDAGLINAGVYSLEACSGAVVVCGSTAIGRAPTARRLRRSG
jgi:hypothetical protein